jgi:hypothetical protein
MKLDLLTMLIQHGVIYKLQLMRYKTLTILMRHSQTKKQLELPVSPMICKQICLVLEQVAVKNVSILVFKSQNILSLLKIMNTTE